MRVANAADYPAFIDTIAKWHWDEWGHADPTGSLQTWTSSLRRRVNRDHVPMTFVAIEDPGVPIGSVCLVENDMLDRDDVRHLTPWIAGTFVVPAKRSQGVGTALMQHVVGEAGRIGAPELFLYTSTARCFYEKLGWRALRDDFYEGEAVTIMTLRVP